MKRKIFFNLAKCACAFFLAGGVMACSSDSPEEKNKEANEENKVEETVKPTDFRSIDLSQKMRDCNDILNTASIELFYEALQDGQNQDNVIISPLSINYVLVTLVNGANGETKKEILDFMKLTDLESANDLFKLYSSELATLDNQVEFSLGNSLWIDAAYQLHPQFKQTMSEGWPVEIFSTKLGTEQSRLDINSWVAKNTNNLIPEFLKETLDGPMGVFNTLYFNGKWANPFDVSATSRQLFDNTIEVDMMHGEREEYVYARGENWQGVALPYGNGNYQMRLVLPDEGVSIKDLKNFGDRSVWNQTQNVKVSMPKFECGYRAEKFERVLSSVGIKSLFDREKSDLSNILLGVGTDSNRLWINRFIHEAVVKVSESGAEMAAVSGVGSVIWDGNPTEYKDIDLTFDRPFIFEIRETSTNTLIFIGAIRNP